MQSLNVAELDLLVLNFARFGVSERALWHYSRVGSHIPRNLLWSVRNN
jgi:hypothetical protein